MSTQDAIGAGIALVGATKLAAVLRESPQTITNWRARGSVPVDRCAEFEAATGIARWELRPDDWHRIWPELVGTEGAPDVPMPQAAASAIGG